MVQTWIRRSINVVHTSQPRKQKKILQLWHHKSKKTENKNEIIYHFVWLIHIWQLLFSFENEIENLQIMCAFTIVICVAHFTNG